MSVWDRLRARFRKEDAPAAAPSPAPVATKAPERTEEEELEARLAKGQGDVLADARRLADLGHEPRAAAWLERIGDAAPAGDARDELLAAAARLYFDRGDDAPAERLYARLGASRTRGADAHAHLATVRQRAGDLAGTRLHLEAALARDARLPGLRARLDALLARAGESAPLSGATIAGPSGARVGELTLLGELGRGATGVVYRARDEALGREVAVKLLHAHLPTIARARFFTEARVAAALRHPHIAAVFDLDERALRLVMELGEGTLADRVRSGPLPPALALRLHAELLSALAAAHASGVVHRDVKLANALVRPGPEGPELMLADFGAAHLATPGDDARKPEAIGSLATMAPEQRRGDASPAVDLWAAGVVLWHTLVGRAPWTHDVVLAGKRGPRDLALPQALELPPALDAHLLALGALDPAARPTAREAARTVSQLRIG